MEGDNGLRLGIPQNTCTAFSFFRVGHGLYRHQTETQNTQLNDFSLFSVNCCYSPSNCLYHTTHGTMHNGVTSVDVYIYDKLCENSVSEGCCLSDHYRKDHNVSLAWTIMEFYIQVGKDLDCPCPSFLIVVTMTHLTLLFPLVTLFPCYRVLWLYR